MRIVVGKLASFVVFALLSTPLTALAQNIASRPGTVDRSVERMTLLPGPSYLSKAPGAPTSGATIKFEPTLPWRRPAGAWTFQPSVGGNIGTLSLSGSDSRQRPFAPKPVQRLPSPESLRFDATLQAPPKLQLSK